MLDSFWIDKVVGYFRKKNKMALTPYNGVTPQGINGIGAAGASGTAGPVGMIGHAGYSGALGGAGGISGGGGGGGWNQMAVPVPSHPYWAMGEPDMLNMLSMRMRWGIYRDDPLTHTEKFNRVMVCRVDDRAIITVCNEGHEPVVIVDKAEMFPSDTLITQLRLLEK